MSTTNISERIRSLSPLLIDRLAAGEVIEAPASVIKELMENAIDAGASSIYVETEGAGLTKILVRDDGSGIYYEDLPAAIERHATSKISDLQDVEQILTFGFRGEALASIASVSHLEIKSQKKGEETGGFIRSRGGKIEAYEKVSAKNGTSIAVEELFFSTPARKKYVKSEKRENQRNQQEILKIALAHPGVRIEYVRDGREMLSLPSAAGVLDRIRDIYGETFAQRLIPVDSGTDGIRLTGYAGNPDNFRSSREVQFQFVNGRAVEIKNLSFLVKKAYGELLGPGNYPVYFLFIEIDPLRVDVNVHPAKKEVRLMDEQLLQTIVYHNLQKLFRPQTPFSIRADEFRSSSPFSGEQKETYSLISGEFVDRKSYPLEAFSESENFMIRNSGSETQERPFVPTRHFGVLFGTFILAEGADGLYIIDQHTAHERVNYERVRKKLNDLRNQSQPLLHPMIVDCLADELERIVEHDTLLRENGFVVEQYGPKSYIIRDVPAFIEPGSEMESVVHTLQRILEGETAFRIYDEYAAMRACKASIKRNDAVSGEVISSILLELAQCENPSRCPHGRPTMIKITPEELDRLFHR